MFLVLILALALPGTLAQAGANNTRPTNETYRGEVIMPPKVGTCTVLTTRNDTDLLPCCFSAQIINNGEVPYQWSCECIGTPNDDSNCTDARMCFIYTLFNNDDDPSAGDGIITAYCLDEHDYSPKLFKGDGSRKRAELGLAYACGLAATFALGGFGGMF